MVLIHTIPIGEVDLSLVNIITLLRFIAGLVMILDSYAADLLALLHDWLKAPLMAEDLSGWVEPSLVQTVRSIDIGTLLVDTPIVAISDADARS